MEPTPTEVSATFPSIPEKIDFLRKAFCDLEEHKAFIASCSRGWKELDASLSAIYDVLEKRHAEIVEKETKFEERTRELQDSLDKRETVIESREQASLARVQEQKDAAISAILEQKRKWIDEKKLLESQSVTKPNPESASSKAKQKDSKGQKDESGKAKPGVTEKDNTGGKDKDNHDTVANRGSEGITPGKTNQKDGGPPEPQKIKDKSSDTDKIKKEIFMLDDFVGSNGKPGSVEVTAEELKDHPEAMETSDDDGLKALDEDASDDDEKDGSNKKSESSQSVVTARQDLISLCEKMDGPGLYVYLISQKKVIKDLQKELPIAMKIALDPSQLVLQGIKDYQPSDFRTGGGQSNKIASRRSCITLLESLAAVFDAEGITSNDLHDNVKEKVKAIAESWKSKLNLQDRKRAALLDVQAFLQLVATFGLAPKFSEDELCDHIIPICFRKQTLKLWRALGLAHKTKDLVDRLIKDLKHIDALSFVQEYQLTEKFPPVNLIKAYLGESRKGHTNSTTREDKGRLHTRELNAARAVRKCVERYKLEGEYPLEGLQRRIEQLEKLRSADKKRVADTNASGLNKARAIIGLGVPFRPPDRFGGRGYAGRNYGLPYARGGGGGYPYPPGGRGYLSSITHGSYQYGGGPPYQGPYLR